MPIRKKHNVAVLTTALIVLLLPCHIYSQDAFMQEGFIGRGIANIVSENVDKARQEALADAQRKVIMAAISTQLPIKEIESYFLLLKTIFFDQPTLYLHSFKIIYENKVFDTYQIAIQGLVQQDILKRDLESLGLLGPEKEKTRILLMVAEKLLDAPEYTYWWSPPSGIATASSLSEQNLKKIFNTKGFYIIDPFQTIKEMPAEPEYQNPEPDIKTVLTIASQCNAEIVILAKSELVRIKGSAFSSLKGVQCNIHAKAIDAQNGELLMSAAGYAPGINIDESAASKEAVEKACSQVAEQITDKLYLLKKVNHSNNLWLKLQGDISEEELKQFMTSFKKTFPEIVNMHAEKKQGQWLIEIRDPVEKSVVMQKIFENGIEGYKTTVISTGEHSIELSISPYVEESEGAVNNAGQKRQYLLNNENR